MAKRSRRRVLHTFAVSHNSSIEVLFGSSKQSSDPGGPSDTAKVTEAPVALTALEANSGREGTGSRVRGSKGKDSEGMQALQRCQLTKGIPSLFERGRYWQENGISIHTSNSFGHNISINSTQKDVVPLPCLVGKPGKLVMNCKWFL